MSLDDDSRKITSLQVVFPPSSNNRHTPILKNYQHTTMCPFGDKISAPTCFKFFTPPPAHLVYQQIRLQLAKRSPSNISATETRKILSHYETLQKITTTEPHFGMSKRQKHESAQQLSLSHLLLAWVNEQLITPLQRHFLRQPHHYVHAPAEIRKVRREHLYDDWPTPTGSSIVAALCWIFVARFAWS